MLGASQSTAISPPSAGLASAIQWLADLLIGTLAVSLAIVAIAVAGLLMLQGRLGIRDGARTIAGCFIVFGAPIIAKGLWESARPQGSPIEIEAAPPFIAPEMPAKTNANPDPYAGASVPMQ
jgi:type IV secretory pathway VirB2 component (pilin)